MTQLFYVYLAYAVACFGFAILILWSQITKHKLEKQLRAHSK